MKKIAIIGAGSMSEALISGIVSSKLQESTEITVTNRGNVERLIELQNRYGVDYSFDLKKLVGEADAIILAMKPKDVKEATVQWKKLYHKRNTAHFCSCWRKYGQSATADRTGSSHCACYAQYFGNSREISNRYCLQLLCRRTTKNFRP